MWAFGLVEFDLGPLHEVEKLVLFVVGIFPQFCTKSKLDLG
jgi:hypothetical protein